MISSWSFIISVLPRNFPLFYRCTQWNVLEAADTHITVFTAKRSVVRDKFVFIESNDSNLATIYTAILLIASWMWGLLFMTECFPFIGFLEHIITGNYSVFPEF
jgi:hypothetical protein